MEKPIKVRTYRGVDVFLSGAGNPRFYADVGGAHHWGGSFDTLRKKLDAALTFEPFAALVMTNKGVEQVQVEGVDTEESAWCIADRKGMTHGGTRSKFYHLLFPLSMRDQLESYLGECEIWDRIEEENKAARNKMREELEARAIKRPDAE